MPRVGPILFALSVMVSGAQAEPAPLVAVDGPGLLKHVRDGGARLTVVNVWATWCRPCLEEFPDFLAVGRAYREKGVRVVFVTTDFGDDKAKAVRFLKDQGAPLPSFIKAGKDEAFIESLSPTWVGTLPATFIFDGAGRRVAFFQGRLERDELQDTLDKLLASPR